VAYLAVGGNQAGWTEVRDGLRSAPGDESFALLAEVLRNPLMAALARTAYKHRNPAELLRGEFRTPGEVEEHLLGGFLREAYENRPGDRSRWNPDRARAALSYLAGHLEQAGSHDLAWWEIGTTLSLFQRMLAVGTLCGMFYWLVLEPLDLPSFHAGGIPYLSAFFFISVETAATGLAFGLVYGLAARFRGPPKPTRIRLRLRAGTRKRAPHARLKFRNGMAITALGGTTALAVDWAVLRHTVAWTKATAELHLGRDGLPFILSELLGIGIALGLGLGLLSWIEAPAETETVNGPLAFLRRNRATVCSQVLLVGLTSGLALGIAAGLFLGPLNGFGNGLFYAVTIGTGWVLSLTAWGQWLVFARVWLPLTGRLPWRLAAFLDDAHQRGVLRQSGAVYQFRHDRLRDHLARKLTAWPG
jgi:hypothetical protein